jgi:RNA polymerase sigma-B factor
MMTIALMVDVRRMTGSGPDDLLQRYARSREPTALEALTLHFRPLALRLAARYARRDQELEDLQQVASLALVKALRRFDPDRGAPFTAFAVPTILGELRRFCRDTRWSAHVPRALQERAQALRRTQDDVLSQTGRAPSIHELAERLGWAEEDVVEAHLVLWALVPARMDAPVSDDEAALPLVEALGVEDHGFETAEWLASLERVLPSLTPTEQRMLRLRFARDLNPGEIARRLDIPRSRVGRALESALERLRVALEDSGAGLRQS